MNISIETMKILSFSGGRTSAYMMANYACDLVIFTNTGKEAEGTLEFVRDCEQALNKPIIWLEYCDTAEKFKTISFDTASRKGEPFEALIRKRKYLPNQATRFCSMELKALTIKRYLKACGVDLHDTEMMLGIRADEPNRYYKLKDNPRNTWENSMPLFRDGVTKEMVLEYWSKQPFDLLINPYEGNCDLCFLKGMRKKTELLRDKPQVAQWWINMEELIGATFHKGYKVREVLDVSQTQTKLFDNDIECFCSID